MQSLNAICCDQCSITLTMPPHSPATLREHAQRQGWHLSQDRDADEPQQGDACTACARIGEKERGSTITGGL